MSKGGAYWRVSAKNMGKAVTSAIQEHTSKRAKKLFDLVVQLSPVHTGAYRASWTISAGAPTYRYVGRQSNRHQAVSNPLPGAARPRLTAAPFTKFYITNGSPYAYKLEQGWSDQAPAGVVRLAIQMIKYV